MAGRWGRDDAYFVSATIGGVNCDVFVTLAADINLNKFYIASAVVPTGTTATAVITFSGSVFSNGYWGFYTTDTTTLVSIAPTMTFAHNGTAPVTTVANVPAIAWGDAYAGGATSGANFFTTPNDSSVALDANINTTQATFGHVNNAAENASSSTTLTNAGTPTMSLAVAVLR